MKYVTLEHRQSLPYGVIGCTYINFDTNDTTFENEAHELRRQRNSKQEEAKNQIIDESGHVFGTILQIKNELNNLRHDTPILKRFSKVYRNERDRLQKQVQDCQIRNNKLLKEAERLEDRAFDPFHEYYDLKTLLKEQGYVLVSKTTDTPQLKSGIKIRKEQHGIHRFAIRINEADTTNSRINHQFPLYCNFMGCCHHR